MGSVTTRKQLMFLALAVTAITAGIWVLGDPPPGGIAPSARVGQMPGHFIDYDIDGDGQNERIWIEPSDPGLGCMGRLIIRDEGVNYAAAEQVAGPQGATMKPEGIRLAGKSRAVAVRCDGGTAGETLHLFGYRGGRIDALGAFFGERGVRVRDVNGDGRTEVVVLRKPTKMSGVGAVEVYVLQGQAFVLSRELSKLLSKRRRP